MGRLPTNKYIPYHYIITLLLEVGLKLLDYFVVVSCLGKIFLIFINKPHFNIFQEPNQKWFLKDAVVNFRNILNMILRKEVKTGIKKWKFLISTLKVENNKIK